MTVVYKFERSQAKGRAKLRGREAVRRPAEMGVACSVAIERKGQM